MGARMGWLMRAPNTTIIFFFFFLIAFMSSDGGESDSEILLKFKNTLVNSTVLGNWDPQIKPCVGHKGNWTGVLCYRGDVWGLRLENMGLTGVLNLDSLLPLNYLRTLSFMNNSFSGPLPNIKQLRGLKSVYFSLNKFSGEIPDDAFVGMRALKKVFLGNNEFTGTIPSSLAALPRLLVARLDSNKFQGIIPYFTQDNLKKINVSQNELEGPIPFSLRKLNASLFSDNKHLCGQPLKACATPKKPLPVFKIVMIVVMGVLVVAVIAIFLLIFHLRKKWSQAERNITSNDQNTNFVVSHRSNPVLGEHKLPERTDSAKRTDHGKLSFVRDDREKFGLQDLLTASAEVLGSATYGSSYKATINSGETFVVKRCKHMNNVGKDEFHEHMGRLGILDHPNLLPLVAYFYRKEEKLLISSFVENASLARHLHGNRNFDQPGLDWQTRLRIIKGVVRGLAYLYDAIPSLVLPHGHLKSSNVLLDEFFEPVLSDYALAPVINIELAQQTMIAYKSPEYAKSGRITKKTDIWCFGILILEVLTGKFPENYLTLVHDSGSDLASWVNRMIKERRTSEVFDSDMGGVKNNKSELLKLLKIGLSCCENDVESRLDLNELVEQIEDLKEGEGDGEYTSSVTSDGDYRGL